MNDAAIKLSYIPAQYRVRLELLPEQCRQMSEPPAEILQRARSKMEAERAAGHIGCYHIYEERLRKVWQTIRDNPFISNIPVAVTLACGAPDLPGIVVEKANESGIIALLSMTAPAAEIRGWRFPLIKFIVQERLRQLQINESPNPAAIHALWLRACERGTLQKGKLKAVPLPTHPMTGIPDFQFRVTTGKVQMRLIINSFRNFQTPESLSELVNAAHAQAVALSKDTGKPYQFMRSELIRNLRSAMRGPERLDIDLPFIALVARVRMPAASQSPHGHEVLRDFYEISISDDAMRAEITEFNEEAYERPGIALTAEGLQADLTDQGIKSGFEPDLLAALTQRIAERGSLKGMVVAQGITAIAPESPYLEPAFQKRDLSRDGGRWSRDIRELQPRKVVSAGEVVAAVVFKIPGRIGTDVLGRRLVPPQPELGIELGEGLRLDQELRVIAELDGLPIFESEKNASLQRAYVHEGNVNLSTGNIHFSGPIHVKGNVEQGALIDCGGDLQVDGMVEGATLRCKGNVRVAGGIVGDDHSKVTVGGDLRAQFLENATVRCLGNIIIEKSIVSSRLQCSKSVTVVQDNGFLVGGTSTVWESISVGNLGKDRGAPTQIALGVNWRDSQAIAKMERRLERLRNWKQHALLEVEKLKNIRRLSVDERGNAGNRLAEWQKRMEKCDRLAEQLKKDIPARRRHREINAEARITVRQKLATSCSIEVEGKVIPIHAELAAVVISMHAAKGNHIRSLLEMPGTQQAG